MTRPQIAAGTGTGAEVRSQPFVTAARVESARHHGGADATGGDGTYLTTSAARILAEPLAFTVLLDGISLFDLVETRLIVEPELAARAAERATMEDLGRLRTSLDAMARERQHESPVHAD